MLSRRDAGRLGEALSLNWKCAYDSILVPLSKMSVSNSYKTKFFTHDI